MVIVYHRYTAGWWHVRFVLCPASSLRIHLPCQEHNFEFDLPQEVEALEPTPIVPLSESVGSFAIYIRLMWFRHCILQATKEAVLSKIMKVEQLTASIEQLTNELTTYESSCLNRSNAASLYNCVSTPLDWVRFFQSIYGCVNATATHIESL